jgi:hypothetical protein
LALAPESEGNGGTSVTPAQPSGSLDGSICGGNNSWLVSSGLYPSGTYIDKLISEYEKEIVLKKVEIGKLLLLLEDGDGDGLKHQHQLSKLNGQVAVLAMFKQETAKLHTHKTAKKQVNTWEFGRFLFNSINAILVFYIYYEISDHKKTGIPFLDGPMPIISGLVNGGLYGWLSNALLNYLYQPEFFHLNEGAVKLNREYVKTIKASALAIVYLGLSFTPSTPVYVATKNEAHLGRFLSSYILIMRTFGTALSMANFWRPEQGFLLFNSIAQHFKDNTHCTTRTALTAGGLLTVYYSLAQHSGQSEFFDEWSLSYCNYSARKKIEIEIPFGLITLIVFNLAWGIGGVALLIKALSSLAGELKQAGYLFCLFFVAVYTGAPAAALTSSGASGDNNCTSSAFGFENQTTVLTLTQIISFVVGTLMNYNSMGKNVEAPTDVISNLLSVSFNTPPKIFYNCFPSCRSQDKDSASDPLLKVDRAITTTTASTWRRVEQDECESNSKLGGYAIA